MPPTRTWCVLDPIGADAAKRTSLTVEWDPIRPGTLKRFLVISDRYKVTCYSEPKYHPISEKAYHWTFQTLTPSPSGILPSGIEGKSAETSGTITFEAANLTSASASSPWLVAPGATQ